ncbi:HAMP domain-containing sensor histidine kinase [Sporolactobacillus pectinivorans]|uniref:HAMP domain-containing sensor histidine kinase n=1 Tax=Sporolactobacillus pectinivorans TaxID=1591408 RepID=UPI000C26B62A|nr:HAMP domain-containing sensor histidine kinase [Sporolactobacillus pectinivorans]
MKLKLKLSLIFSMIVVLMVLMILLYIKMDVADHIVSTVSGLQTRYNYSGQKLATQIGSAYPDMPSIKETIKAASVREKIDLSLYSKNIVEMYAFHGDPDIKALGEKWFPVRDNNGQNVLLLRVQYPLKFENAALHDVLIRTLLFLIISLGIIFILLVFYLNHLITKPIRQLNGFIKRINFIGPVLVNKERRRDEIGELYDHVRDLQSRLKQTNQEQVDLISAITHDIKTPLTSIHGFIELLLTQNRLPEQTKKDYLHLIERKSQDMTQLVNIFSSFTKNEMLLLSIALRPIYVRRFFQNVAAEYETELSGLEIVSVWNQRFDKNDLFYGDETMLRRVFANIISNAVRYGRSPNLQIWVEGYPGKHDFFFRIEDNGIGVPEKDFKLLFQKFFTVDPSRQSEAGGTGLGLASVQSIIEKHGGSIHAFRSEKGGLGLLFSLPKPEHL